MSNDKSETLSLEEPTGIRERSRLQQLASEQTVWILAIFVGLLVLFTIAAGSSFASLGNTRNILASVAIILVMALGEMLVILTAGIDLSIGGVLVFSGVAAVSTMNALGGSAWAIAAGVLVAMLAGTGWGLINGLLVTYARIPPIIATLGTMGMSMGLALVLTGGVDMRAPLPLVENFGSSDLFGVIPWIAILAFCLALLLGLLLSQTRFGRNTYALGGSVQAVERAGISVNKHLIRVYMLAGLLVGIAGFMALARFGTTTLSGHTEDAMKAITAVVLGGTSLFGGSGKVRGVVIGAFIPAVLLNGFVITGIQAFWQQFAIGLVLVIAVFIDRRREAKGNG